MEVKDDMDDDVPSPRTLHAAAERLAQYTSEDVAPPGSATAQGFKDVFSEVSYSACHSCRLLAAAGSF
jgi:hypothetical protein